MLFKFFSEIFALAITILVFGFIFIMKNRNSQNKFLKCDKCNREFRRPNSYDGRCPYCSKDFETDNNQKEED